MQSCTTFCSLQARAPARCTWALTMQQGGCQGYHNLSKKKNKGERDALASMIPVKHIGSHAALSHDRRKGKSLTGMTESSILAYSLVYEAADLQIGKTPNSHPYKWDHS